MPIETQEIRVTTTPQNLKTLTDPDMTDGDSYVITNDDDITVYIAKRTSVNAPDPSDPATLKGRHPIRPGHDWGVTPEAGYDEYVWVEGADDTVADISVSDWG